MKLKEKYRDTWFTEWGIGVVTKILKTRVHLFFKNKRPVESRLVIFDLPHLQFLRRVL